MTNACLAIVFLALAVTPVLSGQDAPPAATENAADRLRPGDRLRLQIVEDGEPPVELFIAKDGSLDAPYLGSIVGGGLTLEELTARLREALEADFYVKATVRLSLLDRPDRSTNRGRVFVTGQVRRVGLVEIDKSEANTVGKVILANGGLSDFADARRIKIFRTNAAGVVETTVVDLREVLEKGRIDRDVPILDGDLIVVDAKLVNW
jgi:polysaccharide export outer membrane protein